VASPLDKAREWLRGFGLRLLFACKLVALLPSLLACFLASPLWWLFTGRTLEPPEWMNRILDGDGY
jgi:hypothetical protein